LIRIQLTVDDVARIRIAEAPDINAELIWAGYRLAHRIRTGRLSRWRHEVARDWKPGIAKVFDLYSRSTMPALLDRVS